jgi:CheY-like chemotaxis protein
MSPKAKHILLADDDEEDLELIEESLLQLKPNAKLDKVSNGRAVIEYLNTRPVNDLPCLIVLDYSMPELNGLQVLSVISGDARFQAIPIVMLSTSNSPDHVKQCKENGAVEYFIKPNTLHGFEAIAENLLALCN